MYRKYKRRQNSFISTEPDCSTPPWFSNPVNPIDGQGTYGWNNDAINEAINVYAEPMVGGHLQASSHFILRTTEGYVCSLPVLQCGIL